MEPLENIRLVCSKCSEQTYNRYIEFSDNYFLNKHVKIIFMESDTQRTESCWVLVKEVNNNVLIGLLANDPILNIGFLLGDSVNFKKQDIQDVFESPSTTNL